MDPFDLNDREIAAYTLTRQRIVSQIDDIETKGGSAGTLKRLKRFGNAFSWYPQFYPQILEDIGGMTDKQLMSALRTEEGFMKLIAPVKGLPIHHKFASRTGGDVPIRTPADVFLDVRKRVYNKFGFGPGNNPINLGAQGAIDERMHQGRFGSKGTVFEESRGLGMAPTEELPILHGKGTRDIGGKLGQDPALLRSQSDEIFNAIEPFLDTQLDKYNEVVQNPVTIKQRNIIQEGIDPAAFDVGRTTEQSTAVRKAAEKTGLDVKFASAFDFSGSSARFSTKGFARGVGRFIPGPMDDIALGTGFGGIAAGAAFVTGGDPAQAFGDVVSDVAVGDLQGGELFDESQDFGEALKQSRQQNARPLMDRLDEGALGDAGRAIKRGGRISFGFGGVKFTLPEYGYSELLGVN
jgi:hypothetical protein